MDSNKIGAILLIVVMICFSISAYFGSDIQKEQNDRMYKFQSQTFDLAICNSFPREQDNYYDCMTKFADGFNDFGEEQIEIIKNSSWKKSIELISFVIGIFISGILIYMAFNKN